MKITNFLNNRIEEVIISSGTTTVIENSNLKINFDPKSEEPINIVSKIYWEHIFIKGTRKEKRAIINRIIVNISNSTTLDNIADTWEKGDGKYLVKLLPENLEHWALG